MDGTGGVQANQKDLQAWGHAVNVWMRDLAFKPEHPRVVGDKSLEQIQSNNFDLHINAPLVDNFSKPDHHHLRPLQDICGCFLKPSFRPRVRWLLSQEGHWEVWLVVLDINREVQKRSHLYGVSCTPQGKEIDLSSHGQKERHQFQ